MAYQRDDVEFKSQGVICRAWHFRPAQPVRGPNPCIVMAHGLGGTRNAGLEPYAQAFAEAGFDVLLFDYRHFGDSGGEPRQLLSVGRELADWQAAIDCARGLPGVDPDGIALWGTSFSGGHVIVAAARDGRVAAVSAQGPMLDGLAASLNVVRYAGLVQLLKLAGYGLADLLLSAVGRGPVYLPLVAPPGGLAMMATADAEPGYRSIAPEGFRNQVSARTGLFMPLYRPIRHVHKLPCPALILICGEDSVAPAAAARASVRRAGRTALGIEYDGMGHFEIYTGAGFQRSSADQLAFFKRVLGARPASATESAPAPDPVAAKPRAGARSPAPGR